MSVDLTITNSSPIQLEITSPENVILEVFPSVIYSVGGEGGGGGSGVSSISNAQGTATGAVTLSGTSVKISKTGNDFAFAVDPSSPFFNATMEQLTAGNGLLGGTITTSGTISADFGTVANKIMEGNDSRVTGLKTMAYQESSNINVTGGNIQNVYTIFNGYTHSRINEAEFVYVINRTGSTISKGQIVYVEGAQGDVLKIALAQADAEATSVNVLGMASEDIADSANGYVMVKGEFVGVRTNNIGSEGDTVYLSEVTAGAMRVGIPEAPNHGVRIGVIVKSAGVGAGIVQLDVDNYQELSELSDVHISGITNGHIIEWNGTNNRWENKFPYRLIEGRTFTSSTTYTFPTGAKFVIGTIVGAGGGGAGGGFTGTNNLIGGGGGAGGAYMEFQYDISHYASGATAIVTIGEGGAGGLAGAAGGNGGTTVFDHWEMPGGHQGGIADDRSRGYFVPGMSRSTTLTDHCAGAGGARRSNTNNVGFNATIGWKGGGGGGGGGSTTIGGAAAQTGGGGGASSVVTAGGGGGSIPANSPRYPA